MNKEELKRLEKRALLGAMMTSAAMAADGHSQAENTRNRLNRLKAKGGVVPSNPGAATMPTPPQPMPANVPTEKVAAGMPTSASGQIAFATAVGLLGGGATALASEVIRGLSEGAGDIASKMRRKALLKKLMERNPEFRRQKETTERYFNLILAYAPSLARDETAITDFLRRQLQYPASSVEFIKQLADLEATVRGKIDQNTVAARVSGSAMRTAEGVLSNRIGDADFGS